LGASANIEREGTRLAATLAHFGAKLFGEVDVDIAHRDPSTSVGERSYACSADSARPAGD
jgi:hypothetical protein